MFTDLRVTVGYEKLRGKRKDRWGVFLQSPDDGQPFWSLVDEVGPRFGGYEASDPPGSLFLVRNGFDEARALAKEVADYLRGLGVIVDVMGPETETA